MAGTVRREDAEMAECIEVGEAVEAICYPSPGSATCREVVDDLEKLGIECIVDYGPVAVKNLHILGRGWSSNVFLARRGGRLVAVKALRPGSRRQSLLWEAAAWATASWAGVAPRLYSYTRRVLVVEPILGPTLSRYTPVDCLEANLVLRRLATKAWLLDVLGILHTELARPGGQVLLDGLEPYIVDYESSTIRRGRATNLTQLLGGLQRIKWAPRAMPGLGAGKLRRILAKYKNEGPKPHVFEEVLETLGEPVEKHCVQAS